MPKTIPAPAKPARRRSPWRGRRRAADAKTKFIGVRCTLEDRELIAESANQAGLSVGAFLRSLALGSPGPRAVRRPFVDRVALARMLGEVGKLGSNINQIARVANSSRQPPRGPELPLMQADIAAMRTALMQALDREG